MAGNELTLDMLEKAIARLEENDRDWANGEEEEHWRRQMVLYQACGIGLTDEEFQQALINFLRIPETEIFRSGNIVSDAN